MFPLATKLPALLQLVQTEDELHVVQPVIRLEHAAQVKPLRVYPEEQPVQTEVLEQV